MNCIKCKNGKLEPVLIDKIEVDKCDSCSGIWFDIGELDEIMKKEDLELLKNTIENNAGHDVLKVPCPKCGGEGNMIRVTSMKDESVHIDTCSVCYGQWLDGGELEKLKNADKSFFEKLKAFI